jgi:hypothetical protein
MMAKPAQMMGRTMWKRAVSCPARRVQYGVKTWGY